MFAKNKDKAYKPEHNDMPGCNVGKKTDHQYKRLDEYTG